MQKILISWEAFREDFETRIFMNKVEREPNVLFTGPTFSLHRDFKFDYDKHVILNSSDNEKDELLSKKLIDELKNNFPGRNIEGLKIKLEDPLDISEIAKKINSVLRKYGNSSFEIFISTGSPNMRVVWFLVQPNFKQNLRLFQIREARFSEDKKPKKVYVTINEFNPNAYSIIHDLASDSSFQEKIYISDTLLPIYEKANLIAETKDVGCLILGENGTGKENLASYIHSKSDRHDKPFIAINCAAYTDELLRSELFGYEKDAFTGANKQRNGVFSEADGGTIFLDEIGDISPKMQVSLLRVIQEKKIQRVGGVTDIPIDVRIIAATNKDLEELCEKETFRWDLYFRLATAVLNVPALRNWTRSDKQNLIKHFVNLYFPEFKNKREKLEFDDESYQVIIDHFYRGNVRELQNLIISLYTFCKDVVRIKDLPERMLKSKKSIDSSEENEKAHTLRILQEKNGNKVATAKALKISRKTLYDRIKKYGD